MTKQTPFSIIKTYSVGTLSALLLSACGTMPKFADYGDAYAPVTGTFNACTDDVACEYTAAIKQAQAHVTVYQSDAITNAKADLATRGGFLVGGLTSAGMFLFESDGAISSATQDNLAGIGLAAALVSGFRGSINADLRAEYFMRSRRASVCVASRANQVRQRYQKNLAIDNDIIQLGEILIGLESLAVFFPDSEFLKALITKFNNLHETALHMQNVGNYAPRNIMGTLDEINHTTFKALQGEPLDFGKLAASLYEAGVANQSLGKVKSTEVDTEIEGLIYELGTPENSRKLAAIINVGTVSYNQNDIFQNFFAGINNPEVSSPPKEMPFSDTDAQSILDRQAATAVLGNHIKNAYGIVKTNIRDVEEPLKLLEACPGHLVSNPPPQPAQANDNG